MEVGLETERRHLERFSVRAFAVVKTISPGTEKMFELYTQDISSDGAFFPMEVPVPAGERIKVTLYVSISALEQFRDVPNRAKITTEGQVVRSDKNGMAVKFAGNYLMSPATS
jgi:PilZ domain